MLYYQRNYVSDPDADLLLSESRALPLEQRPIKIYDQYIPMPRLTGWCNDLEFGYSYSGQTTPTIPWPPLLDILRKKIESEFGVRLPSVLINHYRDGNDYVGFHRDDESCFGPNPMIVSVSCGATRRFVLKRDEDETEKVTFHLRHGDLLIMSESTINKWRHSLPKERVQANLDLFKPRSDRINFTLRSIN